MAPDVLGKDILIEAIIDSVPYPVFCCKTAELATETDEIETTNVNSGSSRDYAPGLSNRILTMTGITRVNNTDGRVNIIYLMQQQEAQSIFTLRATLTNQNSEVAQLTFDAFLKSTNWSKDVSTTSNSSAVWRITGGITYATSVDPPTEPVCEVQDPLYLTLAEGETAVSDALLNDPEVTILGVARETQVYSETSGTPGNLQFKHNGANVEFYIPGNPGGETVWVLYKITPIGP